MSHRKSSVRRDDQSHFGRALKRRRVIALILIICLLISAVVGNISIAFASEDIRNNIESYGETIVNNETSKPVSDAESNVDFEFNEETDDNVELSSDISIENSASENGDISSKTNGISNKSDDNATADSATLASISNTSAGTTIRCFVSDGSEWIQIDQYKEQKKEKTSNGTYRVYSYASELEEIFGAYGFDASTYSGEMFFPQTDTEEWTPNPTDYIWFDAFATKDLTKNDYKIWTTIHANQTVDLFYTPAVTAKKIDDVPSDYLDANTVSGTTKFTGAGMRKNIKLLSDNKVNELKYNIHVTDPNGYFNGVADSPVSVQFVKNGETKDITLPVTNGSVAIEWKIYDQNGKLVTLKPAAKGEKTITYSFADIQQSYWFEPITANDVETVLAFINLDGKWQQVGTLTTSNTATWNGKIRYYLTADEVTDLFDKYGFDVSQLSESGDYSKNVFPHNTEGITDNIWFDAPPTKTDGEWRIWISNKKEPSTPVSYLFYTYGASELALNNGYTDAESAKSGSEFYSISATDTAKAFPGQDMPAVVARKNTQAEITVPYSSDREWLIVDDNGNEITEDNYTVSISDDKATVIYTFANVNQKILMFTEPEQYTFQYVTTLEGQIQSQATGQEAGIDVQKIYKDGTINNVVNPVPSAAGEMPYAVLSTDSDTAWTVAAKAGDTKERKYIYTFKGWKIDGTETIIQPGTTISKVNALKYLNNNGIIKLIAQWDSKLSNNVEQSVNFFVRLDCEVIDNEQNGVHATPGKDYTKSIWTTRISGVEGLDRAEMIKKAYEDPLSQDFKLIQSETADSAYDVDAKIKNAVTTPIEYSDNTIGSASFMLESMPSDETIMREVRKQVESGAVTIKIDETVIPASMITSTNFTVRWYVVKYSPADAWHVDGVLVAKTGRIVVSKTFAGDDAAISEVKKSFNISVTHLESPEANDSNVITDYTLTLNSADEEERSGMTGYTHYDESTDTYVWVLTTRQERTYQIIENNYALDTSIDENGNEIHWNSSHSYQISDSPDGIDTNGWIDYDPSTSISVTATAYADDVTDSSYQTVAFKNIYVQGGLLTVQKIDTTTGNGLANVKFKINRADDAKFTLYYNKSKNLYSTNADKKALAGWEEQSDFTIKTDTNGMFFIELALLANDNQQAEYLFEETIPLGYNGPKQISVKVDDHGKVTMASAVTDESASAPEGGWLEGEKTFMLTIKNHSKRLLTLTAVKNWGTTPEKEQKPVKVQLMRNGALLENSEYTQELNSENNWEYTWSDLPLFVDGSPAQYAIRETYIGDVAYDPLADSNDGYTDYKVTYMPTEYWEGENKDNTQTNSFWSDANGNYQFADHAKITVNNALNNTDFSFIKQNESGVPLSGAEFTVWKNLDDLFDQGKAFMVVQSDDSGIVSFGELPAGTYYIYETKAPAGYNDMFSDCLKVTVSNGIAKAEWWDLFANEASEEAFNGYITNYSNMQLTIRKFDVKDQSKLLAGAEFTIYKDNQFWVKQETSADSSGYGTLILDSLEEGDYTIEETKAPSGYDLLSEGITIRVADGKIVIIGDSDKAYWKLTKDSDNDNIYILDVFDDACDNSTAYPPLILPTTGDSGLSSLLITGIVVMYVGASGTVLVIRNRKKKS